VISPCVTSVHVIQASLHFQCSCAPNNGFALPSPLDSADHHGYSFAPNPLLSSPISGIWYRQLLGSEPPWSLLLSFGDSFLFKVSVGSFVTVEGTRDIGKGKEEEKLNGCYTRSIFGTAHRSCSFHKAGERIAVNVAYFFEPMSDLEVRFLLEEPNLTMDFIAIIVDWTVRILKYSSATFAFFLGRGATATDVEAEAESDASTAEELGAANALALFFRGATLRGGEDSCSEKTTTSSSSEMDLRLVGI